MKSELNSPELEEVRPRSPRSSVDQDLISTGDVWDPLSRAEYESPVRSRPVQGPIGK